MHSEGILLLGGPDHGKQEGVSAVDMLGIERVNDRRDKLLERDALGDTCWELLCGDDVVGRNYPLLILLPVLEL